MVLAAIGEEDKTKTQDTSRVCHLVGRLAGGDAGIVGQLVGRHAVAAHVGQQLPRLGPAPRRRARARSGRVGHRAGDQAARAPWGKVMCSRNTRKEFF